MAYESEQIPCYRMFDRIAVLAARAEYLANLQKFVTEGKQTDWTKPVSEQRTKFGYANNPSYATWTELNIPRDDDHKCRVPIGMFQMLDFLNEAIEFEVSEFEDHKRHRISRVRKAPVKEYGAMEYA